MFTIAWQFGVPPAQQAAFEAAYGPEGPWALLFRESDGYRGTDLFRRTTDPLAYVTFDRWASRADYEAFRRARGTEYAALDAACESLTLEEHFLGAWES